MLGKTKTTMKQGFIILRDWVRELMAHYIFEPLCNIIRILKLQWFITIIALVACVWCVSYFYMAYRVWPKIILVTAPVLHVNKAYAAEVDTESMGTEEYIKYVFGKDAKMALAVSKAENGTRSCERFNVNTNKTVDYGVFMINTVHLQKGWKVSELIDCHTNIDYAYRLFKSQGWGIWVAYQNKSYLKFL